MRRQWLAVGVMVVASGLAGCSGGSDDKPATGPAKTSSAPASTPTPAPAPTTPPQPQGANGVTYEIQNWDQYANDPAVLAWKQTLEGVGASTNAGKVLEPMRKGMAKRVLRPYVQSLDEAIDGGWTLPQVAKVKIDSASPDGKKYKLVTCLWGPTVNYYDRAGKPVGVSSVDATKDWIRQEVTMTSKAGGWVISELNFKGSCAGDAPS